MALPARAPRRRISAAGDDLFRYERALVRSGFTAVAGIDEAGRGACAGPLVIGAVVLRANASGAYRAIPELGDSKGLTPAARDRVYELIVSRSACWSVVVIPAAEVDRLGLHRANIEGMRRALARLDAEPDYVLSDGFAVPGTRAPNLGVWKGDQVCASVAAAGIVAKVTRDRIMSELHEQWPKYGFDVHKGYVTPEHRQALNEHGPSPVHRYCFAPVRRAAGLRVRAGDMASAGDGEGSNGPGDDSTKGAA